MRARHRKFSRAFAVATTLWALSAARAQPTAGQPTTVPTAAPATSAALSFVERANADAVARLYAQIAGESLDGRLTVGQVIESVGGRDAVTDGLRQAQQIGGPRAIAEGLVQVNLEIGGPRAAQLVLQAVEARPERSPIPPQRLATTLQAWKSRTFGSTGNSGDPRVGPLMRSATDVAQPTTSALTLPAKAPAWAEDPQTASGTAESDGAPLRTARAAESVARRALHERLAALPLDDKRTIANVAADRREVNDAIDALADAAKIAGVDYRADGSVEVRVSIDGRQVWRALLLATQPR